MLIKEVMIELERLGNEQTKQIYINHGADIPLFGVSIANIKKLSKQYKNNHELGLKLLHSNNVGAIYLSQFILDASRLTIKDYTTVIKGTDYYMILDNVIANLIARNRELVFQILNDWLPSTNKRFRQISYAVYSLVILSYDDNLIDKEDVKKKIEYVKQNIHNEENRVRYNMNNFLIAAGTNYGDLTSTCKAYAKDIGKVKVFMGNTSCKVPDAYSYIQKIEDMGNIGKKRKI